MFSCHGWTFLRRAESIHENGSAPPGGVNDSFLGPSVVVGRISNGPGEYADYSPYPNGNADWQCVSNIPPEGDTTYAYDGIRGEQLAVALSAAIALASIGFLMAEASTRAAGEGAAIAVGAANGTTAVVFYGPAQGVEVYYVVLSNAFDTNPFTENPWTLSDMISLQASVQTAADVILRVNQLGVEIVGQLADGGPVL